MLKFLSGLLASLATMTVQAEDIDRYLGLPGPFPPIDVLVLLDNSAAATKPVAWPAYADCAAGSPVFCYERAVLKTLGQELAGQPLALGLVLFSGRGEAADGGAYVRAALRTLNDQGSTDWVSRLNALSLGNDTGASPFYALALQEAYRYFQGLRAGQGMLPAADPAAFATATDYRKPLSACQRRHLVIISQGEPDGTENMRAETGLIALGGRYRDDPLALSPADHQANWADEYARHLRLAGITSHILDVTTNPTQARSVWLRSIAREGRGHYAVIHSIGDLQRTLRAILKDIPSAAYLSATVLPGNPARPGFQLPQVYASLFRPSSAVRWNGNLKHYAAAGQDGRLSWLDRNGFGAVERDTGRFLDSSQSFWTTESDYWRFRCADARATVAECGNPVSASDAPDGAVVEKGGAGQNLRQRTVERSLFTCGSDADCPAGTSLGSTDLTRFNASNSAITPAELAVTDTTERNRLIAWVRGEDNTDLPEREIRGIRPSVLGDAIHTRPVVLDYNRSASGCQDKQTGRDVVVFQAGNDGVLHAFRGGPDGGGAEWWGFIPHEAWPRFKRLRDDVSVINLPSIPLDENNKPYLFDGPLTIQADDTNQDCRYTVGVDSVLLFAAMGRAGRTLYAFDVTEPEHPLLLWRKNNDSPGFAELGQTWSSPLPVRVRTATGVIPALILGAGYDPAANDRAYDGKLKGYQPPRTTQAGMGRGVFILSARTGEILKHFGATEGMNHAIPSDVAVLRRRDTGLAYRGYVGDTGGTVWRIDLEATDPAQWRVSVLARLGGAGIEARKFMFAPDVVPYDRGYAVLLGSGDSEQPFDTTVTNRFFMLRDEDTGRAIACESVTGGCDLADAGLSSPIDASSKGWFLPLAPGEQVRGSATTLAGTVYFSTHTLSVAEPLACNTVTGNSRRYALNYITAAPAWPESSRYRQAPGIDLIPPIPFAFDIPLPASAVRENAALGDDSGLRGIVAGNVAEPSTPSESTRQITPVWWYRESENGAE